MSNYRIYKGIALGRPLFHIRDNLESNGALCGAQTLAYPSQLQLSQWGTSLMVDWCSTCKELHDAGDIMTAFDKYWLKTYGREGGPFKDSTMRVVNQAIKEIGENCWIEGYKDYRDRAAKK